MSRDGRWLVGAVIAAATLLIGVYVLMGGGRYDATAVADPCAPREWRNPDGAQALAEQVTLSALDGAACDLGVSREALARSLASDAEFQAFSAEHGFDRARAEQALRRGLYRAIDDASRAGAINGVEAFLLRRAVGTLPMNTLVEAVRGGKLDWLGALIR